MALETAGVRLEVVGLNQFTSGMASAQRSVESFASSGASINRSLSTTGRAFSDASRGASGFGNTISTQAATAQRGFGNLVSGVVGGSARLASALAPLAAGVALTGFASSAISTRVTFERELANVSAIARSTAAETEQLSQQAIDLGSSTAFSATDALGGQRFLAQAGFEIPEIIEALPGILSTAAAAQEDLATTSDIVSNALSGFNLEATETGRVSDVLVAAITGSNTDLVQLGTALSFAAPNAAALGVSVEETAAAIGLLSNAGIQSSRAGTTLRGALQRLAAPTAEAAAEMQRLGINAFDTEGNLLSLPDVLAEFEEGLTGLNAQQQAESLNTIVGTIAGTGFTALLAAGSDELRSFTSELEASGGVAEQVAGRQLDNLAGDLVILESATEGLSLALTRSLTPSFRVAARGLTSFVTATTGFVEGLNEGGLTLNGFSIALQDIAPNVSFALGALSDIQDAAFGLSNINLNFDGIFGLDTFRVFRFEDLFSFEFGDLSGQIRGAFEEVSINLGDFVSFDFVSGESLSLNIADFITFDSTNALTELSIGDFISFTSEDVGDLFSDATANITKLTIGDFIDFTGTTGPAGSTINVNDVIIGTYDLANNITTVSITDIITGTLDLTTGQGSVTLGEDLTFEFDLGALQTQIQSQLTGLQDAILGTSGGFEAGTFIPPTDGIVQNIQSSITNALSGDFTFELPDIGGQLQTAINVALGGIVLTFALPALATAQTFEIEIPAPLLDFSLPDIAGQTFEIDIPAPLLDFVAPIVGSETIEIAIPAPLLDFTIPNIETQTFEVEIPAPALNFLAPVLGDAATIDIPVPTALTEFDFGSLFGDLESLGGALSSLDDGLAGATGDDSTLASFVALINEQIGGLATTLDSIDSTSVGESITGVIISLTSIFTQLNTIDDLALGGIAGSLGSLTESILNFATGLTAGIDADAVGQAAAESAATFISSFQAVFSEPDLPAIGGAAAGLVAGIGEQLRTAFEPGNFTVVGASLGQLTSTIIEQLSATFSDPQFAADIGTGLSDILVGITQGLADTLDGLAAETEGAGAELSSATTSFVSNLISAFAVGLADADYGSVVSALLQGIGNSLTSLVPGLSGGILGGDFAEQTFAEAGLPTTPQTQQFSLGDTLFGPDSLLAAVTGIGAEPIEVPVTPVIGSAGEPQVSIVGNQPLTVPVMPLLDQDFLESGAISGGGGEPQVSALSDATSTLSESAGTATESLTQLAAAQSAVAESAPSPGVFDAFLTAFGFGGVSAPVEEARRTGLGTGAAFDETDISGSIEDQILSQLNFGDLPETISTAATDAIATAIPAESLIDSELITTTLSEAVTAAIPAEPVIDADTVNETLLAAAQEAIPPSDIPAFPGWRAVLDFRLPRIPNFPSWRQVLNFRVPRIPGFPGWGSFINFDIPSIPAFPGWEALTGVIDLATLIPPFPGWETLINVTADIPNISCDITCGGGSGGGGGGTTGGGGGGAEFSPFQTGTQSFAGGLALVSEAGDEAIIPPRGAPFIAQGEQLLDLPAGTQIVNASQTAQLLNGDMATIGGIDMTAQPATSPVASLMQSPPSVTNVVNNTRVENNFNLTTETLRSSESVNNDFAMMERLASVSGVI